MLETKIHPIAALFPPLSDEELEELAADIKERGLLYPIVLDGEGQILDGRNRLAACSLVGVAPQFITYEGEDPGGYALAVNLTRRHLTKGQQAMILAKAVSVSDTGLSRNGRSSLAKASGVSETRIANARVVLQHAADLADNVVAGILSLDTAYQTARQRKADAEDLAKQLEGLKRHYADLEERVQAEEITLAEALAEAVLRQRKEEEEKRLWQDRVRQNSRSFGQYIYYGKALPGVDILSVFDNSVLGPGYRVTKESIREAGENLLAIAEQWEDGK